jgi:N-acetylmuramoyl-L-alanine amidase
VTYHLPIKQYAKRISTDFIAIHCADTKEKQDIGVKEIREWHKAPPRGWADVGYHYVIRRDGTVELGRPLFAVGAHVEGYNSRSVGICLVGGMDTNGDPTDDFTPVQMESLEMVVRACKSRYPKATVQGHTDFPNVGKNCPTFDAKAWWANIVRNG